MTYSLRIIESSEDLANSLDLDIKANLGWGIYSGDAFAHFFSKNEYHSYSVNLLVDVVVSLPTKNLQKIVLDSSALSKAKELDYETWTNYYGNQVVTGITTGGNFGNGRQFGPEDLNRITPPKGAELQTGLGRVPAACRTYRTEQETF